MKAGDNVQLPSIRPGPCGWGTVLFIEQGLVRIKVGGDPKRRNRMGGYRAGAHVTVSMETLRKANPHIKEARDGEATN